MNAKSHTTGIRRSAGRPKLIGWTAAAAAIVILTVSHRVSGVPHTIPVPFLCQPSGQLRAGLEREMSMLGVPEPTVTISKLARAPSGTRYIQQIEFSANATSGSNRQQPVSFSGETRFHRSRCTLLGEFRPETPFPSLFAAYIPEPDPESSAASE